MFKALDKLMYAGLGAMSMTRERAEKIFDDYVQRGQAEKGSRSEFIQDMLDTAEKTRSEFEKVIGEQVKRALDRLDLPTKQDLARIEEKLDALGKREQ